MLFTEEFVGTLRDDPYSGVVAICDNVLNELSSGSKWEDRDYEVLVEAFALLQGMQSAKLITLPGVMFDPGMPAERDLDCRILADFMREVRSLAVSERAKHTFSGQKAHFEALLGARFVYEFTQGDLDRIQELLGELRERIRDSDLFDEEHRRRLLLKLEKLQTELHKKMSSLDRLWGITGELGVVLGKFGEDAKPLVDRFKEIMQITWRTQSRAEDMPSDSPPPLGEDGKPLLSETAD